MATTDQVRALVEAGHDYASAARRLSISPGLAYLLATGLPADGSGSPRPDERAGRPPPEPGAQRLINPPAVNPTRNQDVIDWVGRRAAHDLHDADG
jgi:hypothetical protein